MDRKRVSGAVLWSAVDIFFRYGFNFIIIVLLMRYLEPNVFGLIAMLGIFVSVASLFIDGGMSQALIQRQNVSLTDESSIFFLNLALGLIIALGLSISAPLIVEFYKEPVLKEVIYAMALNLFINALGSVHISLLTKKLNFKLLAKISMIASLVSGVTALLSAYNGLGLWSLVLQTLTSSFLTVSLLWYAHPWRPKLVFSFPSICSFWGFSFHVVVSGLLYRIYSNVFAMMIGRVYSSEQAGFFSQAQRLQQLPVQLLTSIITRVAFPVFSSTSGDKEKLVKGLRKAIMLGTFMSVPIAISIFLLAESFVLLLFGNDWLPSVPILQALSLAALLMPIQMLNSSMLKALGRADLNVRIMLIKFLLGMLILSVSFPFGIVAVAIGFSFSTIIYLFVNAFYMEKLLGYGALLQLKDVYSYSLPGIVMILIILLIKHFHIESLFLELVSSMTVGGLSYILICIYMKMESTETLMELMKRNRK